MAHTAFVLITAAMLLAAGEPETELHVEHVDDSDYPEISVVVSAPQLGAADPDHAFRVVENAVALPVEAAAVQPDALEVAVLVDTLAVPGLTLPQVRSAVMDLMLRLPPDARVSLVAATDPPEVAAWGGTPLQARILAASELTLAARPAPPEALLDLTLQQFSYAEGSVRRVVVVGGGGDGDRVPDELASRLAARQVTVHVVQPAADGSAAGADRLVGRLSHLYRLTFLTRAQADEVQIQVVADELLATTTVALPASADPFPPVDSAAVGDVDGGGDASPADDLRWSPLPVAMVAIAVVLLLSLGIALPSVAARRGSPRLAPNGAARGVRAGRRWRLVRPPRRLAGLRRFARSLPGARAPGRQLAGRRRHARPHVPVPRRRSRP